MLCGTVTNPAAGVIATKPTTAPIQAPKADTFRPFNRSKKIHVSIAAAEAELVVIKAFAASPEAPNADPALKPNQPNQSIPVPKMTKGIFVGSWENFFLLPKNIAPASAANPALMCTTVPPAKSAILK